MACMAKSHCPFTMSIMASSISFSSIPARTLTALLELLNITLYSLANSSHTCSINCMTCKMSAANDSQIICIA